MPMPPHHRIVDAGTYRVPRPFRSFALRSDEACHAHDARAPYGQVHAVRTGFPDAAARAAMTAHAYGRVAIDDPGDVDYAPTTWPDLAALALGAADLAGAVAAALQHTGVLGHDATPYLGHVVTRVDFLASRGAGFHNDVARHWSRCLFWVLALDADDVEFVMPHAAVRLAVVPGDLLVFDPCMAHGLCRSADHGEMVDASFDNGDHGRQLFLTGELLLSDGQWAALGAPWLPVEHHETQAALDLLVAEFDDRSGAIKSLRALRDGMRRSTHRVDDLED